MKTIIKILICLLSFNSVAQIAPLEDHTWYLEKLIIGGQTIQNPALNSEVNEITAIFENGWFVTTVCNYFDAELEYSTNPNSFYVTYASSTLGSCSNSSNQQFENSYTQDVFIFSEPPLENHVYTYSFSQDGTDVILTIENEIGNQAIYRNQQLAVGDKEIVVFSLYPNPTTNSFQVTMQSGEKVTSVRIFSLKGKEVLYFKEAQHSYDISKLSSGLYFVHIKNKTGKSIQKIVKQ
ncbi:T9SS type A sorting domain-containing protein [Mesonia aquimarina]|uniref:T9SS type A sorting domain-containing protein n=1 Tax=Mesonia aquimarina TaxID=1504967 RepID=UPI000EF5EF44|nr:T9SS type A sorting domain-containing protein [Mesonia aquimarina]